MAKSEPPKNVFHPPSADRQINFHKQLVTARQTLLMDSLMAALATVDPESTHAEIHRNAPKPVLQILAAAAIRDEYVFPSTAIITLKPTLIGYYRLLLGSPQKSFYHGKTGLGRFKNAEVSGKLNPLQQASLPEFCAALTHPLAELVRQISPTITIRDVQELPLLTLGSQLQGANNNTIGKRATECIFAVITTLVKPYIKAQTAQQITIVNSAKRVVVITQSADPDLSITEKFGKQLRNKVAIEIKGGTDQSNVHNRAGEAEKSHQKAKNKAFNQFWTIIAKRGQDLNKLKSESPTTTEWFDATDILAQTGEDWQAFKSHLEGALGIRIK